MTETSARTEVEQIWHTSVPSTPGRDANAIWRAAADGSLAALLIGAVDPADAEDPALVQQALERAGFIVSLEVRASAVTARADVVLPVAPTVEKAGRYVTWEGRRRPFERTLSSTAISDAHILDALADELDVRLGLRSVDIIRAELSRLAPHAGSHPPIAATQSQTVPHPAPASPAPRRGQAILATWPELLDAGRAQDGDENLAGTVKPARAVLSPATAAEVGVDAGELIAVSTQSGTIVVPAVIEDMPDRVVWLPTNARGCAVRTQLAALSGALVGLTSPAAPPLVGVEPAG